jgi:hypothetical protein
MVWTPLFSGSVIDATLAIPSTSGAPIATDRPDASVTLMDMDALSGFCRKVSRISVGAFVSTAFLAGFASVSELCAQAGAAPTGTVTATPRSTAATVRTILMSLPGVGAAAEERDHVLVYVQRAAIVDHFLGEANRPEPAPTSGTRSSGRIGSRSSNQSSKLCALVRWRRMTSHLASRKPPSA